MNRRTFLKRAAAAGASLGFPTIIPASVRGQNAPGNRVNLAFIGFGNRGGLVAQTMVKPELAVVVALADCFEQRRKVGKARMDAKFGGDVCKTYRDYREILARPDIDAVVVATHDHWHVPLAIAAARANKHMYIEKPLSPSIRWSQKLRRELAGKKLVFQYGTNQRGDKKNFHTACDLVANGYIGRLKEIHAWCPDLRQDLNVVKHPPFGKLIEEPVPAGFDYDMWIGPAAMNPYGADRVDSWGGWHRTETSIGYVAGWGAHPLDIALWGAGRQNEAPVRYEAKARLPHQFTREELLPLMRPELQGTLDMANMFYNTIGDWDCHAEFADGLKLRFMAAPVAKPELQKYHCVTRDHGTTFFGEEGWVGVDRSGLYSHDKNKLREVKPKPGDKTVNIHGDRTHMDHFLHAVKTGAESGTGFEAAFASDLVSHMTNLSARLQRKIQWDPKTENIAGDDEANALLDVKPRAGYEFFL